MENVMVLAGLATAMALSLLLALGLEWLCLCGAFLLMPSPHARVRPGDTASHGVAVRASLAWARVPNRGLLRLRKAGLDR